MRASAGYRRWPFGHVSERATQRLEAENALVLVRRSCRGGARALPRHSELWSLARTRLEGIWAFARAAAASHGRRNQSRGVHCPSKEAPPVVGRRRCGVRAATFFSRAQLAPTSERGWGASLNLTRFISLDARGRCGADGADSERQRCHGRAARPRVRWFACSSTIVTSSCTRCEWFAGCRRVWFRWFSFFDCCRSLSRLRLQETSFFCLHLLRV